MKPLPRDLALPLLRQLVLRHWRLHLGQTLLLVGLLAVGVAVFLSVRLANRAAVASFSHFTDVLTGSSDWVVTPNAGALPEETLREMRRALGARPVHLVPVLEVVTATPPREGKRWGEGAYTLLGVDLFAAANLERTGTGEALPWRDIGENKVWAPAPVLAEHGQSLELVLGESLRTVALTGPIPAAAGQPAPPERLLIANLPAVQEWLGRRGSVDRVEVIVERGPRLDERRREVGDLLRQLGEGRWSVETPGARRETAETMTAAFRLNLTILSLIALLVGLYLIGQTLEGTVVRRRAEIATLRSLGVTEKWIQLLWLAEAALLGLVGSALGLALGWLGAQVTVRMVGATVNALYFTTSVTEVNLHPAEWLAALGGGTLACLAAAWAPARTAAATPPAQLLAQQRGETPRPLGRTVFFAVACLVAGAVLASLPGIPLANGSTFPWGGHLSAFVWIAGAGLLAGPFVAMTARYLGRRASGAPATVALGYLRAPTRRHRIALGGLVCATAMAAGMLVLVASFEASVKGWIAQALKADLYISSLAAQSASAQSRLSQATVDALGRHPGVAAALPHWLQKITLQGRPTQIHGAQLDLLQAKDGMLWLERPRPATLPDAVPAWASETFLRRFDLNVGATVEVPTPSGPLRAEIVAAFSDYGNEQGALWLDFATVRAAWRETGATSVALLTEPGVSVETLRAELRRAHPGLGIYANAALRAEILRIFHQTFSLTYALEVIGLAVALAGLALTLVSMGLERRSDLTTLRALGFSRSELAAALRQEATVLAAVAALLGVVLSIALGWVLVYVINRQSFGWTLQWVIPWTALGAVLVLLTACGALTGHWVGRWSAALPADNEDQR